MKVIKSSFYALCVVSPLITAFVSAVVLILYGTGAISYAVLEGTGIGVVIYVILIILAAIINIFKNSYDKKMRGLSE